MTWLLSMQKGSSQSKSRIFLSSSPRGAVRLYFSDFLRHGSGPQTVPALLCEYAQLHLFGSTTVPCPAQNVDLGQPPAVKTSQPRRPSTVFCRIGCCVVVERVGVLFSCLGLFGSFLVVASLFFLILF